MQSHFHAVSSPVLLLVECVLVVAVATTGAREARTLSAVPHKHQQEMQDFANPRDSWRATILQTRTIYESCT